MQVPRVEVTDVGHKPQSSGEVPFLRANLPPMGGCTGWTGDTFAEIVSLPLLPAPAWLSYPFLWRSSSASFQVFFNGSYSICSCRLGVSVGGGEFRVLLCGHLELPPEWLSILHLPGLQKTAPGVKSAFCAGQ